MPFGFGPRACVGYQFSVLTVKVFLVLLLSRHKVVITDEKQTLKFGAILEPSRPFEFVVREV
jgi:cytochrome P450